MVLQEAYDMFSASLNRTVNELSDKDKEQVMEATIRKSVVAYTVDRTHQVKTAERVLSKVQELELPMMVCLVAMDIVWKEVTGYTVAIAQACEEETDFVTAIANLDLEVVAMDKEADYLPFELLVTDWLKE